MLQYLCSWLKIPKNVRFRDIRTGMIKSEWPKIPVKYIEFALNFEEMMQFWPTPEVVYLWIESNCIQMLRLVFRWLDQLYTPKDLYKHASLLLDQCFLLDSLMLLKLACIFNLIWLHFRQRNWRLTNLLSETISIPCYKDIQSYGHSHSYSSNLSNLQE